MPGKQKDGRSELLDYVPGNIALVNDRGVITAVNSGWLKFGRAGHSSTPASDYIGTNYLTVCEASIGENSAGSLSAAAGIRAVLAGSSSLYFAEYPCHSPTENLWFSLTVTPLRTRGLEGAMIVHSDITAQKKLEEKLQRSESELRQISEHIRDVFFLFDIGSKRFLHVSSSYEEIWGETRSSLYQQPRSYLKKIPAAHRKALFAKYRVSRQSGSDEFECHFIISVRGEVRWMSLKIFAIRDNLGKVTRITGVAENITERKIAERELIDSEHRFSELLQNIGLSSVLLDINARVTYCNDFFLNLTGWGINEVIGQSWFAMFTTDSEVDGIDRFQKLLTSPPEDMRGEYEIVKKSGERRLISWNRTIIRSANQEIIGVAGIGEDITDQRIATREIFELNSNLERLSAQLINAQEQERINLARELHDDLGQRLALLKIDLHHLQSFLQTQAAITAWEHVNADVLTLIEQTRSIALSLRPPTLDYLGLEAAIEQLLTRQFANGTTQFIFEYAGLPSKLQPNVEITIYRIVQEGITNIVRHAKASKVIIEINGGASGQELELIIRDNGIGFVIHANEPGCTPAISSGLIGMRERANLLGGDFKISSSPGAGTRIAISITLD